MEKKLVVKDPRGNGNTAYLPDEIICCEADREYTTLYIITSEAPGWYKHRGLTPNLGQYEKWLINYNFLRVTRQLVVNLDCIADWDLIGKEVRIILKYSCFEKIWVGPEYKDEFLKRVMINYN
jgi:hypothetical protein